MSGEMSVGDVLLRPYRLTERDVTLKRFLSSRAAVTGLMGPVGGGKTVALVMKPLYVGLKQQASPVDGVRRTKWCVVRDTYRNLDATTIPTFLEWFPKRFLDWSGGKQEPSQATIRIGLADGTRAELIYDFRAIGDRNVEDVLRGLEVTGFAFNEADRLNEDVIKIASGRMRYPSAEHGGPTWTGISCDFNAPSRSNWTFKKFVKDRPAGWQFLQQPSGRAPDAENLQNLPKHYYANQLAGADDDYVRRFIDNEFGFSREGKPVYIEYNDNLHYSATEIPTVPGRAVVIGLDAGRTPAAVFCQLDDDGQLRILGELIGRGVSAAAFGEMVAYFVAQAFPRNDVYGVCDPSADDPNDISDRTWREIFETASAIDVVPAKTNEPNARQDAVKEFLRRTITGQKPCLVIDDRSPVVRDGFIDGYHFKRVQGASDRYGARAEKNEFSHPHDALQYAALELSDEAARASREVARNLGHNGGPRLDETEFDPLGDY